MASNRSRAAAIDSIKQKLSAIPQSLIASCPELQSTLNFVEELQDTAPTLPVRSLEYDDVLEMFHLTENLEGYWTLEQHDIYNPSDLMMDMLNEIQFVVERSPKNEAYARCILNNILICCVAEEKRVAISTAQIGSSTAAFIDPTRPSTPTPEPAELYLRFETALKYRVSYKKKARTLSGIADFTLWYDDKESMATNLVVVEAKKYNSIGEAAAQVVAYIAIIHATRCKEGKRNSVVYGICSDGNSFRFSRIDNEGVLWQSSILEWRMPYMRPQITSYVRYIVRAAIASSPTTTPVKGHQNREVRMGFFSSPDKGKEFDYGIGNLGVEDEDDDDIDIVDPSRY